MGSEKEYTTKFDLYNVTQVWIIRILLTLALIVVCINYSENPQGLSILAILIVILLFLPKTEIITINQKQLEITRKHFYDLIPIKNRFEVRDILLLNVTGNRTFNKDIIFDIVPQGTEFKNKFYLKLRNDKWKTFKTSIYLNELEKIKEVLDRIKQNEIDPKKPDKIRE